MIKRNFSILLCLCLCSSLFFSCSDDDEGVETRIVGAWQLSAKAVDGQEQSLTGQNEILLFEATAVFKRYLVDEGKYRIGGWNLKADMLNISVDLPAAYYIESANSSNLVLRRLDFNTDGNMKETITTYQKVSADLLP